MGKWDHVRAPAVAIPADVGSGDNRPFRVFTDGVLRMMIDPITGAQVLGIIVSEPSAPDALPAFFVRLSGGRQQLCVKFDSGPTQILATEP